MYVFPGLTIETGPSQRELPTLESIPQKYWEVLATKRIFFGHQSVGYNVVEGLRDIMNEHKHIALNIVEASDLTPDRQPCFAHGTVGENRKPRSKIEAFVNTIDQNSDARIDIALMKLCYVDIEHDSDVDSIFQAYSAAMAQVDDRHPAIRVVHVTAPLESGYSSPKWRLKQSIRCLIGWPTLFDDNLQRHRYNELLREEYGDTGSIFDLARAESTAPQGQSSYIEKTKATVPSLWIGYTDDGGHLNQLGRRKAAEQLLITLARMASPAS